MDQAGVSATRPSETVCIDCGQIYVKNNRAICDFCAAYARNKYSRL